MFSNYRSTRIEVNLSMICNDNSTIFIFVTNLVGQHAMHNSKYNYFVQTLPDQNDW